MYHRVMTRALGKPAPLPYIDEQDLIELAADLGSGVFPSATLYDWYCVMMRQASREPVSKVKFGLALKEAGWLSGTDRIDGVMVRTWMINKPWARRGEAWLAEELRKSQEAATKS